ncbi:MAG: GreA/GreB family elongation factor [Planctomycetota bacterium]
MSDLLDRLSDAIDAGRYRQVDDLWLEWLEAEEVPAEALAPLVERLAERGEVERAVDLVLSLAPDLVEAGRHAEALPLLRAVALHLDEANEDVRAGLVDCYRHLYRRKRHAGACIDRSGILTEPDLGEAVRRLDRMLSYEEGDYVYHPSGWGVGQITGFHPLEVTATIDFEAKPGHVVPLESLENIFERLDPDDFRVLRTTDPERLRQLGEDDPARLVRKVLAAREGRVTLRGLRTALQGTVIPKGSWGKWWTRARAELRRDPLVETGSGSNPVMTLRAEALTYEEEMRAQFERLVDLRHQTELVREYARNRSRAADAEAFLAPACRAIAERLRGDDPAGEQFEASLLLTRLKADVGEFPGPDAILAQQADPVALLNALTSDRARRRAFELLGQQADDWAQTCREVLLRGPAELWDAAVAGLGETEGPPTVQSVVEEVLAEPRGNLDLLAWLGRGLLTGRLGAEADPKAVFELLLTEGDEVARAKRRLRPSDGEFTQTETLTALRQALRANGLAYFDELIAEANEGEASRLLFRIRQSSVLTEQTASQLERKIMRKFPRLLAEDRKEGEAAGPEYIYATPEGIASRRAEHERLVNVEIPEIERRIGEAAAMGDISDNADWRTAIEERTNLTRRASQMAEELSRARPIEPAMVHTDHVSIGSKVTIANTQTGETATYLLLGPWDADTEHHIMSYTAPLARALMRHRVGDEVTLDHAGETATYRIVAIDSALAGREETRDA